MFGFLNLDANADNLLQRRLKSVLTCYLMALQPWSFSMSLAPVALGNVLSWRDKSQISLPILILSTIVVLSVHAAGNAVHAYRDRRGKPENQSPNAMVQIGVFLYLLSCSAMLGVVCISPAKIEHLALLFFGGLSASFLYTGGWSAKTHGALRELLIIITFGPIAVLFSFVAQCGHFDLKPVLYALPLALNAEAIIHSANVKDMERDKGDGTVTTATILGHQGSYVFYLFLLFTPYIIFSVMLIKGSLGFVFPLITLRGAFDLEKCFRQRNVETMPSRTARLNSYLAVIYILVTF